MTDLIEIDLKYTVIKRPDFDTIQLANDLRAARHDAKLTIAQVAQGCGVTKTEAEHWFRTDAGNAPPSLSAWPRLRNLLGIRGWEVVGEYYETPAVFEMGCRAYHERGIAPTVTASSQCWVMREP